ncbi:MAG TPA: PilZ domain-containing protein [Thermoanaerobaculia bacterium]|nr:PilZ domain-containing protein [Thermoanaerobaculia bacterium]
MSRRVSPRRPRRVQVQFWKRDEPHAYPGYTTNISMTGMFIATRSPYPPGTRLRIEVLEGDRGFVIEGVVAHARKIRGELMRLSQPGMGVRFLGVEELVRELIPVGHGIEALPGGPVAPVPPLAPGAVERELDWTPVPPLPSPAMPTMSWPRPAASSAASAASAPPSASPQARPAPSSPPIPTPREGTGTFAVQFLSPEEFVEVYRRDIVNGGLFVSTRYPGRLQETVSVELHPPFPGAAPVLVRARVVQRFEPSSGGGPNLLSGMGVELLDLPALVEKLQPYVESRA